MKDYTTITIAKETRERLATLHTLLVKKDLVNPNTNINTVLEVLFNIAEKNI